MGAARIVEADGGLRLLSGLDQGVARPLTHHDRDLFTMVLSLELPDTRSTVTFRVGADGRAASITIDVLDDLGMDTLTRDSK